MMIPVPYKDISIVTDGWIYPSQGTVASSSHASGRANPKFPAGLAVDLRRCPRYATPLFAGTIGLASQNRFVQMVDRNNGRFVKGVSGNPGGRPKLDRQAIANIAAEARQHAGTAIATLIKLILTLANFAWVYQARGTRNMGSCSTIS